MKKLVNIAILISCFLISYLSYYYFENKEHEKFNSLKYSPYKYDFKIEKVDVSKEQCLEYFSTLTREKDLAVVKTDKSIQNRSIVKAIIYDKNLPFGDLPGFSRDEIDSVLKSGQEVTVEGFSHKNKITLLTLDEYYSQGGSLSGSYKLVSDNDVIDKETTDNLNKFFGIDKPASGGEVTKYYPEYLTYSILLFAILTLLSLVIKVSLPIRDIRRTVVKKLLGFRDIDIAGDFFIQPTLIIVFYSIAFTVYVGLTSSYFPLKLVTDTLLIYFALMLVYWFIDVISLFALKKLSISSVIKNKLNLKLYTFLAYFAKLSVLVFIMIFSIINSTNVNELINFKKMKAILEKSDNYITVESYLNNRPFDGKEVDFFNKLMPLLESEFKAEYFTSTIGGLAPQSKYYSEFSAVGESLVNVNENYMKNHKLVSEFPDSGTRLVVASKEYEGVKELDIFLKHVMHSYMKSEDRKNTNPLDIKLKLVFMDLKPVFSYRSDLSYIDKPIYMVSNPENRIHIEKSWASGTGIDCPIKIPAGSDNKGIIDELNILTSQVDKQYKIDYSYQSAILKDVIEVSQDSIFTLMFLIVVVFIINIFSSSLLQLCVMENSKKLKAVEKLLGIGLLHRYKNELIILIPVYLTMIVSVFVFGKNLYAGLFFVMLVIIDLFITVTLVKKYEKDNLVTTLKGV